MRPPLLSPPALKARAGVHLFGTWIESRPPAEVIDKAAELFFSLSASHLVTANTLLFEEMELEPRLKTICQKASLVVSDSAGLSWAARTLGEPPLQRYPGIDLALDLCRMAERKKVSIFLLGGAAGVAEQAASFLKRLMPGLSITGMRDGFFKASETPSVIEEIRQSGARFILVALGMPKQDLWISDNQGQLPAGLYMGVGGTFDIWAGRLKRAPKFMRNLGLEWLYRLGQEPSRWRRMKGLPVFAWRVLRARGSQLPRR